MKSKLFRLTMLLIVMFIATEPGGENPSAWSLEPSAARKAPNEAAVENAIAFSVTEKGDTLETIAGKRQIYDSPLKWPLIYFLMSRKADIRLDPDFTKVQQRCRRQEKTSLLS